MGRQLSLFNVPDADLAEAYRYAQECVRQDRLDRSLPLSELANEIDVGHSALKQFMHRTRYAEAASLRRGSVFAKVYEFYAKRDAEHPKPNLSDLYEALKDIGKRGDEIRPGSGVVMQRGAIYSLLMHMLKIGRPEQDTAAKRVFKRLYCFRNAAMRGYFVKSELDFNKIEFEDELIWEFFHRYIDDNGLEKRSDGVAFVINKTVYLLGDVQNGEGLDIFLIREPVDDAAEILVGFHVSIDDHRPLFANIVCFDADIFDRHSPENNTTNFQLSNRTGVISKRTLEEIGIFGDKENAENLTQQLNIEDAQGVLRIKLRHLISRKTARSD